MWKTGVAWRDLHSMRFWGSNPSCLCATFVAIKTCCCFGRVDQVEDWFLFKDATSWEMTTDAFWYACLFAGKFFAMQLWQQKLLENLHHFWTPKWRLKKEPKNGARIWSPKWSPKIALKKRSIFLISCRSLLNQNIWPPFWVPFLDSILRVKFWHHFWVHFSTSILRSKNGANFPKVFAVKAA